MLITLRCIVMLSLVVRLLCWICNEQFLKIKYVLFTSQSRTAQAVYVLEFVLCPHVVTTCFLPKSTRLMFLNSLSV